MANQRKKKQKDTKKEVEEKIDLNEQLDRAQAAVEENHRTALKLHSQWRSHMLRMSYIVMIVTLQQAHIPSTSCIKEVKQWNEIRKNSMEEPMSGFQAFVAVLNDSVAELLSLFCTAFLLWCLSLPMANKDFSSLPYRLSCVCIPLIVSMYFSKKEVGCISDESFQHTIEDAPERPARGFPVILIFHTIVSLSLWFMQYQVGQHDQNIEIVKKLKKDLMEVPEESDAKKVK